MSTYRPLLLTLLLTALSTFPLSAHAAGACNAYTLNGVLREYCDFSLLFDKYRGVFDFRNRIEIRLPNLVPDGIHYLVNGGSVGTAVDVENVNAVGAFAHQVAVAFSISQMGRIRMVTQSARVAGVPGGSSVSVALATIDLLALGFTRDEDIDVLAMIIVDPVTMALARGEIIEDIETDNMSARSCRIYGNVHFDTSVRRCR